MNEPIRLLVVEDSRDDTLLLVRHLERAGRAIEFERVDSPEAFRSALDRGKWDVVVADHGMPRFSSLEALKLLTEADLDIPFIIVSGTIGE